MGQGRGLQSQPEPTKVRLASTQMRTAASEPHGLVKIVLEHPSAVVHDSDPGAAHVRGELDTHPAGIRRHAVVHQVAQRVGQAVTERAQRADEVCCVRRERRTDEALTGQVHPPPRSRTGSTLSTERLGDEGDTSGPINI